MSAKVFAESADVIQDQAKVLYEYLSKAAKKIVDEEMRIENEIANKKTVCSQNEKDAKNKHLYWILSFSGAGIVAIIALAAQIIPLMLLTLGLAIAGVMMLLAENKHKNHIQFLKASIKTFEEEFTKIRRDYKVYRLGVAYVPVATRIPFEGKSFILDRTQDVKPQEFNLYSLKNPGDFVKNIQELEESLEHIPMVEGTQAMEEVNTSEYSRSIQQVSYYDYLGKIDRSMRAASFGLNDLEHSSVSMPVVDPQSPNAQFLRDYGTTEATYGPVVEVFPSDANQADLEKFQSLNEMKRTTEGQTAQFNDFLQGLMTRLASTIQMVTKVKIGSTDHMVAHANNTLFTSLKSAYNHYSPQLEAEEIERIRNERFDYQESVDTYRPFELKKSSRVLFDAYSGNWVSEDGRRTSFPFGIHQIHEEIIAPIVQNLMAETRVERLKIYNGIKDQKLDYLNQWHRDTDDFYGRNRAEGSDLMNLMQASLTEFTAAFNQYKAFEETQKAMAASGSGDLSAAQVKADGSSVESVAVYEAKSGEFRKIQNDFNDYADRLKEEIDRKAEEFGYIEFFDASLRDAGARDYAGSMSRMDSLDARRKTLLGVNPHFAETADLPPTPHIEEEVQNGLSLNLTKMVEESMAAWSNRPAMVNLSPGESKEDPIGASADKSIESSADTSLTPKAPDVAEDSAQPQTIHQNEDNSVGQDTDKLEEETSKKTVGKEEAIDSDTRKQTAEELETLKSINDLCKEQNQAGIAFRNGKYIFKQKKYGTLEEAVGALQDDTSSGTDKLETGEYYCTECNGKVLADDKVCGNCGADVSNTEDDEEENS